LLLLITVYVIASERIHMSVQRIFRFLVPAVRSSLCCGTPQPELRRAVRTFSMTTLLHEIRQGRA
ncbi:hypothetical protein J9A52_26005, partial [Klebsiella pneumoniae]